MQVLLVVTTVLDLAAVGALCWFLRRTDRERDAALEEGRAALERLRGDLAQLVSDAETRARVLEESLGARIEGATRSASGQDLPVRRPGADPAEARLLRDLDMSFGEARRA
jgi:hypothetical protein